jgi:hypothetical protein
MAARFFLLEAIKQKGGHHRKTIILLCISVAGQYHGIDHIGYCILLEVKLLN